jgi:DNA-binding NarL/FixJ family response regulator
MPLTTTTPHLQARVLLVDDHDLLRTGLRVLIDGSNEFEVVGEAATGEDAVELARRLHPDVVVMDLRLPGIDGIEATRRIMKANTATHVLVLTMDPAEDVLLDVFEAGGSGYLRKTGMESRLMDALRAVAAGKVVADPALVEALRRRAAKERGKR